MAGTVIRPQSLLGHADPGSGCLLFTGRLTAEDVLELASRWPSRKHLSWQVEVSAPTIPRCRGERAELPSCLCGISWHSTVWRSVSARHRIESARMATGRYMHRFDIDDQRSVHIYQGSLVEVRADALVSSDDNY